MPLFDQSVVFLEMVLFLEPSTFGFKLLVSLAFCAFVYLSLAILPKIHLFLWTKNVLVYVVKTSSGPWDRIWISKLISGEKIL